MSEIISLDIILIKMAVKIEKNALLKGQFSQLYTQKTICQVKNSEKSIILPNFTSFIVLFSQLSFKFRSLVLGLPLVG